MFTYQVVFALINALTLGWFLQMSWLPVVRTAVEQLPDRGEITQGTLKWGGTVPRILSYNSNLAFVVDPEHSGDCRVPTDILIELGNQDMRIYSLVGYLEFDYPPGWRIALNRPETAPWWGAWEPPVLWFAVLGWTVFLLILWMVLASGYSWVVWLLAFFANRSANLGQSWKLASTALIPASLVLWLGIVFYGGGGIHLVVLLLFGAGHVIAAWIYMLLAAFSLDREKGTPPKGNPFSSKKDE